MNRDRGGAMSDAAMLAVVGAAAGLAGAIWLWGGLAGLLFGHGWPRVGAGQLLEVIVRLPGRLARPASAWPAHARPVLPRAAGFYAALGVLAAATGCLAAASARLGVASRLMRRPAGARWAGAGELRPLHGRARAGRLALGRYRGRLLHAEQRHALVAFGPPQSGKSAGLAVPALLEWDGPAVASSIKTDLLACTERRRRGLGPTFVFDPFELSGAEAQTWSPLRGAATWDGALEVAWRLAAAGELDHRGVEGGDFWAIAAEQRLAPLLFAAAWIGDQVCDCSPANPNGSNTNTVPSRRRRAAVTASRSVLIDEATTGPCHSSSAGTARPADFPDWGGPKATSAWRCSAHSSLDPRRPRTSRAPVCDREDPLSARSSPARAHRAPRSPREPARAVAIARLANSVIATTADASRSSAA